LNEHFYVQLLLTWVVFWSNIRPYWIVLDSFLIMHTTLTRAQARESLERNGITIADWARAKGVDPDITYRVLDGKLKGRSGEAHKIAVLLGIKDGVIEPRSDDTETGA